MDPTEFQSVLDSYKPQQQTDVSQPTIQPQQVTTQPQQHGNWFTHLLPTAGGILGGIVGIPGDLLSGGVSSVGGAAAGSGIGKAIENKLEGQGVGNGVLSNAIQGAAGEGIGRGVGAGLGKGAELLASKASKITNSAKTVADTTAADAAKTAEAAAIKNNYGGIKPGVQSANKLQNNQDLLQSWGLDHTDPNVMASASKGGLFLNDIDEAALAGGKPIKTTDLISSHDITSASPEEQTALINAGIITPQGSLPHTVTPIQANKFAQDLNGQMRSTQGLADNAFKNGDVANYNTANQHLSDLTSKYKNVQELASGPEVNASIATRTISPEEKAQLVDQYGQSQAEHLEKAVNDAKTHQDLVTAKLPFAQMNTLSKQALGDMQAPATARGVARAKADINGDGTADVTLPTTNVPGLASDLHSAQGTVGKALVLGKHAATSPGILNTLSRMGSLLAKGAPAAGVATATSNNLIQAGNPMDQSQQPPMAPVSMQQPQQGLSRNDLLTLALYSPGALASITPNAQQVQNTTNAQSAETALNGLGNAPSGGILSSLQAKLGIGGTGEYQRQAASAAQQIAAAIPGTDPGTIEKQLTNYMAGGGNIQDAINGLMQQLHGVVQANQTTGLGGILGINAGTPQTVTSQL